MGHKNKFGLSRNIPSKVKKKVREKSKFGCVICRNAIYNYEHIAPEYTDAKEHDPDHICLLCPTCHLKVTKGIYSKQRVSDCYQACTHDPEITQPFSDFEFQPKQLLVVTIGDSKFISPRAIITIDGVDILSFIHPTSIEEPPSLNGVFCDSYGNVVFEIRNNEWFGPLDCWDMEIVANWITIKSSKDKVALALILHPPSSIEIAEIDMRYKNSRIFLHNGRIVLERSDETCKYWFAVQAETHGADSCIYINTKTPKIPVLKEVQMRGGEGIELFDTGMIIGRKNDRALVGCVVVYPVMPNFSYVK